MQGGVVDYETNLRTGGVGARTLGIGASRQFREDTVTVTLRTVSVLTGEILIEVLSDQKNSFCWYIRRRFQIYRGRHSTW